MAVFAVVAGACSSTAVTELTAPSDAACAVSASMPQQVLAGSGEQVTVPVTAARDCLWSAASQASWLQVSPTSGQGDAALGIAAGLNPGTESRTGVVIVNNVSITFVQAGTSSAPPQPPVDEPAPPPAVPIPPPSSTCAISLSPSQVTLDDREQSGVVSVSVANGCAWTAVSTAGWIEITSSSTGIGAGSVRYTVARYRGKGTRSASIVIGGQMFSVTQRGDKED